jgi:predicted ATPase
MRFKSIRVGNAWSFGNEGVRLSEVGQHNVIIGKNNSGKSKLLAALAWVRRNSDKLWNVAPFELEPDIYHDAGDPEKLGNPSLRVTVQLSAEELAVAVAGALEELRAGQNQTEAAVKVYVRTEFSFGFSGSKSLPGRNVKSSIEFEQPVDLDAPFIASSPNQTAAAQRRANWDQREAIVVHKHLLMQVGPSIKYISGWRTLRETDEEKTNIVKQLHVWKAPQQKNKEDRYRFFRVESIFQRLMLCPQIELVPEHNGERLSVALGPRYLPIEALGDGIQHLLMIAYHLATAPRGVLLIEEPETHLHPELQRNLMAVMRKELSGQSFITTHSPVLLDSSLASTVFRVEHDGRCSSAAACQTSQDLYRVLDQLDVRASDILQANFVVWVEGPTDRMFLKRCFELLAISLTEGVHYQIAYYGGRLRSHVTFDEMRSELVNLLRLCRKGAMICDSDKRSADEPVDESKRRLGEECEAMGLLYWVTDGREIENYLPDETLTEAYRRLLGDESITITLGQYDGLANALSAMFPSPAYGQGWKVDYADNKAKVMPELLRHLTKERLDRLGVRERIDQLIAQIGAANQCDTVPAPPG